MWGFKPILAICLLLILLVAVAAVVVLALIPVYLRTRDVTVAESDAGMCNLYYLHIQ